MKSMRGLITSLALIMASCSTIPIDRAMSASDGNDPSIFLSGCGEKLRRSTVFCEAKDGAISSEMVTVKLPVSNCDRATCVFFQTWRKDGTPGFSGSIGKGSDEAKFSLSDMIGGKPKIDLSDDGEYLIKAVVYWKDNQGVEHRSNTHGFIRLNVIASQYTSVACDGPEVAWNGVVLKDCSVQYTTALRSVMCGKGCE